MRSSDTNFTICPEQKSDTFFDKKKDFIFFSFYALNSFMVYVFITSHKIYPEFLFFSILLLFIVKKRIIMSLDNNQLVIRNVNLREELNTEVIFEF